MEIFIEIGLDITPEKITVESNGYKTYECTDVKFPLFGGYSEQFRAIREFLRFNGFDPTQFSITILREDAAIAKLSA